MGEITQAAHSLSHSNFPRTLYLKNLFSLISGFQFSVSFRFRIPDFRVAGQQTAPAQTTNQIANEHEPPNEVNEGKVNKSPNLAQTGQTDG